MKLQKYFISLQTILHTVFIEILLFQYRISGCKSFLAKRLSFPLFYKTDVAGPKIIFQPKAVRPTRKRLIKRQTISPAGKLRQRELSAFPRGQIKKKKFLFRPIEIRKKRKRKKREGWGFNFFLFITIPRTLRLAMIPPARTNVCWHSLYRVIYNSRRRQKILNQRSSYIQRPLNNKRQSILKIWYAYLHEYHLFVRKKCHISLTRLRVISQAIRRQIRKKEKKRESEEDSSLFQADVTAGTCSTAAIINPRRCRWVGSFAVS